MEAEVVAKGSQTLIDSLGYPAAVTVVVIVALYLTAKWIANQVEGINKDAKEREAKLSARLEKVTDEHTQALNTIVKDNTGAMKQMCEACDRMIVSDEKHNSTMLLVNETMREVRRDLLGSSGKRPAVT